MYEGELELHTRTLVFKLADGKASSTESTVTSEAYPHSFSSFFTSFFALLFQQIREFSQSFTFNDPEIVSHTDTAGGSAGFVSDKEYDLSTVLEVHSMRYLLQPTAFELHFQDRDSAFFTFVDETAREYVLNVATSHPKTLKSHSYSTFPRACRSFLNALEKQLKRDRKNVKVFRKPEARRDGVKDAKMKWKRRQMSTFQYLMLLNRLGGRSTNDITQYPIFPWILRDYTSEVLDLKNTSTFRNLSKPMGCQAGLDEVGVVGVSYKRLNAERAH